MVEYGTKRGTLDLLIDGCYAIRTEISRNIEAGNRTDISALLDRLGRRILEDTGYRYSLPGLFDLYELFNAMANRMDTMKK